MNVIKTNGITEPFNFGKIEDGVRSAFAKNGLIVEDSFLEKMKTQLKIYENVSTVEIRRQVEEILQASNKRVASAYIDRFKHEKGLKDREDFIRNYIKSQNAATGSKFDSNANVSSKNIATLNAEIPKGGNIDYSRYAVKNKLKLLYGKEIAESYEKDLNSHIIYKHDESGFGLPVPYCAAIQSYPLMQNGLKSMGGSSLAPKHLESFCGIYTNTIFAVSSQFAGAVATSGFFLMFDKYAREDFGDDYYLRDGDVAKVRKNSTISISQTIEDLFSSVVYSINQPSSARGFQSAFVNFAYFDKPYFDGMYGSFVYPDGTVPQWESISYLQKKFMKWFNKERTRSVLSFPVETMSLLYQEGKFVDEEYADFAAEMYSEGHSFFTYISDSADTLSSCCRLSNKIKDNTFSFTNGLTGESTGSKSVITLNFNRIIQNYVKTSNNNWKKNKEDFKKGFVEYITPILDRVYKYHNAYNEILWDFNNANMLTVYSAGFIHLNKQYLTLGINGLNEAWMFLGGECRYSEDYKEFCNLVTGTLSEQNAAHRTKKTMFNSEFVPAENLGVKNYKWDKEDKYWTPEGRNCYTSYFFLPDDDSVSVIEKLKLHGKEFVETLDGGSACHINLQEHMSKPQVRQIMESAGHYGSNYFTFNVKNTECKKCGHISKHTLAKCPLCGSEDLDYYTRIIGYMVKEDNVHSGRKTEMSKRIYG